VDDSILYLSEAEVAALGLDLDALRDAVAAAFAAKARGRADASSKSVVNVAPGHVFQAKPGILRDAGVAGMKWFGLLPPGSTEGPSIISTIVISDLATGRPLAILGGDWITAKRTAAMSAIAAQKLARRDSASIGFVGAGVQGASHLEALPRVLPNLRRAVICSRTEASARRLSEAAWKMGLNAEVTHDPRKAVEGADVIVTTVPEGASKVEFLDPAWVAPGAFVAAVDLARSWDRRKLRDFEILATDDHEQTKVLTAVGRMTYAGPYEVDLADLCAGKVAGRTSDAPRAFFNFSGHSLADLAAAQIAIATARAKGLGTKLPR
jgi:ornithine cyclodeaminase/alanine dehydrogenase-like protein (mu-crystallin family)